jgi:hypothetical protein
MPVTRHPPHRSQRALLTHWAPASGADAETAGSPLVVPGRAHIARFFGPVPGPCFAQPGPLGQPPSLHPLRKLRRTTALVRELLPEEEEEGSGLDMGHFGPDFLDPLSKRSVRAELP